MAVVQISRAPTGDCEDLVAAIQALRERAYAEGRGTLAYLLDVAQLEAERTGPRMPFESRSAAIESRGVRLVSFRDRERG
jgi:hypothetical protein